MTVNELIKKLKKVPRNHIVVEQWIAAQSPPFDYSKDYTKRIVRLKVIDGFVILESYPNWCGTDNYPDKYKHLK